MVKGQADFPSFRFPHVMRDIHRSKDLFHPHGPYPHSPCRLRLPVSRPNPAPMRALILFPLLLLASCTTLLPVEICSAEWIAPRIDRAVDAVEKDTSRLMRNVKSVGESYARGKTPGPLTLFSLSRSLDALTRELTDGRGVRDLRTLAGTCDDPRLVSDGLTTWLDRQGLPDGLRTFIDDFEIIDRVSRLDAT